MRQATWSCPFSCSLPPLTMLQLKALLPAFLGTDNLVEQFPHLPQPLQLPPHNCGPLGLGEPLALASSPPQLGTESCRRREACTTALVPPRATTNCLELQEPRSQESRQQA